MFNVEISAIKVGLKRGIKFVFSAEYSPIRSILKL